MSMKDAQASNWVAENATPTSSGFKLKGSSKGYATFAKAFSATQEVFYSAHDDSGNREAGYAQFDGSNLILRHPTASLVNGVYQKDSPAKVNFVGDVVVACTFNAVAFNTLWSAFDKIDPDGDGNINIPPELIDGLAGALRLKADQVDLEKEIEDRKAGDADLQRQIDNIEVGEGGGSNKWEDITGKPDKFPPADHAHNIRDVMGLQSALDGKSDVGHTHEIEDVNGLDDQLSDIEASIGAISGQLALGASYDASTGLIVHGHITGFEDGQPLPPAADHQDVFVIVSVAGNNPEELSEGDWLVAVQSGWAPIKYGTAGTVDWDNIVNVPELAEEAPKDGEQYARQDGAWAVVNSGGAGMVISADEPEPDARVNGMQWLEATTGIVWIWDEDKWLQFPAGGDASEEVEQYWRSPNDLTIEATKHRVHSDLTTSYTAQNLAQYTHGTLHIGALDNWVPDVELEDHMDALVVRNAEGTGSSVRLLKDGKIECQYSVIDGHTFAWRGRFEEELNFGEMASITVDIDGWDDSDLPDLGESERTVIAEPYGSITDIDNNTIRGWKFHTAIQASDYLDADGNSIVGGSGGDSGEQYWTSPNELTIEATKHRVHADRTTTNVAQNLIQYTHGMIEVGTLDDWVDAEIDDPEMNDAFRVMHLLDGENMPTLQIKKDGKLWNKGIEADEHIIGYAVRAYGELNFLDTVITNGGRLVDYDGNYVDPDQEVSGIEREEIAKPYTSTNKKFADGTPIESVHAWKFHIPVQASEYLDAEGYSIGHRMWTGTQAEYDAIGAPDIDNDTLYFITS